MRYLAAGRQVVRVDAGVFADSGREHEDRQARPERARLGVARDAGSAVERHDG